ncbi:MAG: hydrogenase expression/formation protein HypE [Deltaproteobacteria bacterium]|nr:hydrogenase expression/formation protein HypE [Deltaproteobacteria bacterium]
MEEKIVLLAHGAGGKLTHNLIEEIFLKAFDNPYLSPLNDQAVFSSPGKELAFTTDSYVVNPIFFPGGDIGKLAVCGTINDLAVGGADPVYMSASFIIEEGMPMRELEKIVSSMARTSMECGVRIVTGDTKVVERGKGDKVFINTTGIGVVREGVRLSPSFIRPGDIVMVSGTIGDHGIAVLSERGGLNIPVESDCAPLHALTGEVLSKAGARVKAMRDPTRGGLATILNEFSESSGFCILIEEESIPVKDAVKGACELLGFDPLYLANEGKAVIVASSECASGLLFVMRNNPLGRSAAVIGRVIEGPKGKVVLETTVGNRRAVEKLSGEQLPRIC